MPRGVYSLWSNHPPDDAYLAALARVSVDVAAKVITFSNPHQDLAAVQPRSTWPPSQADASAAV
ncbi:MAG: hypothetical protein ABIP19_01435 [Dermatophilaceae bacterium]